MPAALAIFLRYPEAGRVKSRLAAELGPLEAARIYEKLSRRTLGLAADYGKLKPQLKLFIFFTPREKRQEVARIFPGPWDFVAQQGAHLGERMDRAIRHCLLSGCRQVVLVGTDIADLEASDFEEAFRSLERGFAVLNPASDGGFYLLGVDRPCPSAMEPQEWGHADVFRRTEDLLRKDGFSIHSHRERIDIDRPEDLEYLAERPLLHDRLSIIIPTTRPSASLPTVLDRLDAQLWPGDEIIVSRHKGASSFDGPTDPSARIRFVDSPLGRGVQLNSGSRAAQGNLFLFLHDDCILPDQFSYSVRKISTAPDFSLGCFLLGFRPSNRRLDAIASWANLRTRCLKLPYGDQGLFCRAEVFLKLGGFKKHYLMEDVDFVRRAGKLGKLFLIRERLYTSPQRYMAKGILRASLQNHLIMLLYLAGVSERRLHTLYYR